VAGASLTTHAPPRGYLELLRRNRSFRRLWFGQVVSQLGDWLDYVALVTLLLSLTHSGTAVAGMLVARFLPTFFASPVAGVAADRFDRKRIMVAADLIRAVLVLGLLLVRRTDQVWLAYAIVASVVSMTAFFEPARTASIANVTAPEELLTANALGAITWSVSLAAGAGIGGFLTAVAGARTAFVLDGLSFACSAWLIGGIVLPPRARAAAPHIGLPALLGVIDLADGARYLRRHPPVAALVVVKAGWSLAAGGLILLHSIFGERIYPIWGSAAAGIGLLATTRGVGTAIGPVVARRLGGDSPRAMAHAIGLGFFVAGILYLLFAAATALPLALLALAAAHMGGSTVWVFSTTLLQRSVPDEFRGRVFATELALLTLGFTISNLVAGWAIDTAGLSPRALAAVLGAFAFVPGAAWIALQSRTRYRII
jgi:MFS family permease